MPRTTTVARGTSLSHASEDGGEAADSAAGTATCGGAMAGREDRKDREREAEGERVPTRTAAGLEV
ncbi:hypothetical protein [Actinoplanes derwentensis]|uniref:Uncharacterized protein n=1 Tax=Actinoplanes derwentensis TaxID=113562 RepID=A0A1H2BXP8_9ACTN|nr:hypothetical protein [Actinoplanes derwentensis]GID83172.1 hypothetical protein Ade03nite_20960 [Actinoplanes derwentensis]SDT62689.1 hypothetical protein SAMN04489716_4977 [Actinoplanes derwentensis]